ncbi:hypothetical protein CLBKND_04901 [Methylorubrum aminovorans]
MTHRSLRLCAILGAIIVTAGLVASLAAARAAAGRGDLITMPWSAAR